MDSQRASRVCRNVRRVHSDGPGALCWASQGSSWKRKMYLLLPRQPQGGRLRCCGLRSAMAESSRGKLYLKLHQRHKQASARVCVSEVLPVSIIHIQYSYRYESIVVSGVWGGFLRDPWGPRRVGGGQRGGGWGGKNRKAELNEAFGSFILSWSLFLHTWRHRKEKIHPLLPLAQHPPCRRPLVEAQGSSRCCYRRYPALVRLKISCWVKSSVVATVWFKTGYHRYKKKFQIKFGVSLIQTFYRITFFQLIVFCLKLTVKFTPACEGRFFSAYVFTINTFRVGHTFVAVTMSQGNPASRQMFHLDETITLYPVFTLFTSPTCSPLPLNSSPIPIFTQDFAESTLSHLGETDGHIFTVNNKRQKEEKTYKIKKGIIVQKDKNIKNKNLTKRTLMLHDPRPSLPLDSTRRPLTSNHKQEVTLWAC